MHQKSDQQPPQSYSLNRQLWPAIRTLPSCVTTGQSIPSWTDFPPSSMYTSSQTPVPTTTWKQLFSSSSGYSLSRPYPNYDSLPLNILERQCKKFHKQPFLSTNILYSIFTIFNMN
jgi:hypothetical protein